MNKFSNLDRMSSGSEELKKFERMNHILIKFMKGIELYVKLFFEKLE